MGGRARPAKTPQGGLKFPRGSGAGCEIGKGSSFMVVERCLATDMPARISLILKEFKPAEENATAQEAAR